MLDDRSEITAVNHVRTIHTARIGAFVAVSADFDDAVPTGRAEALIEEMKAELKATEPRIGSTYIRPKKQCDGVIFPALPRRIWRQILRCGAFRDNRYNPG